MTLLSKTLQTLLYKYLSDVDVEGVALPSLYNTDGHSGWGVRLSNVKLRDGAKLMNLPGKPRKRKGRRRKEYETPEKQNEVCDKERNDMSTSSTTPQPSLASTEKHNSSLSLRKMPSMTSVAEEEENQETACTDTTDTDAKPVSKRSSRWFGWYYGTKTDIKTESIVETVDEDNDENYDRESSRSITKTDVEGTESEANESLKTLGRDDVTSQQQSVHETNVHDRLLGGLSNGDVKEEATSTSDGAENDEKIPLDVNGIDKNYPPDKPEESPFILRLGKNGHIGVLDVRLGRKNRIHVLVEDASLTVEITSPAVDQDMGDNKDPARQQPGGPTVPPKAKELKTVGDRVLAENAIARMFSAIPNLLLRDIRIRVIVRGEDSHGPSKETEDDIIYDDDTVLEFGIELLSVTDGEDFLANFRAAVTSDDASSENDESSAEEDDTAVFPSLAGTGDKANDYEFKRIRTGRGPEGGITLRVYSGSDRIRLARRERLDPIWACQTWRNATDHHLFRISGLDVHARIFMGENEEASTMDDFFFDDFNVDTMLFGGVDYIAPGPQPPLPPMTSEQNMEAPEDQLWTIPGATNYVTDSNGIQRCGVNSCFHRVARGLRPCECRKGHLPCENCSSCWFAAPGKANTNELDSSTPMGGLVLHASFRDTIEVNIDRPTLETIGSILDLFRKKEEASKDEIPEIVDTAAQLDDMSQKTGIDESQRSTLSFFSRNSSVMGDESARDKLSRSGSRLLGSFSKAPASGAVPIPSADEDVTSSYPSYMKPEKIEILGLHIAEIRLRVHIIRPDGYSDSRYSFCYWDLDAKCLTVDLQRLSAPERPFQDIRLDIGHLSLHEFRGIDRKRLLSLGIRQPEVDIDALSAETMTREPESVRPPWPSTASALLDLPPPLETLVYENRQRHAVQIRYCTATFPEEERERIWGNALLKIGAASIDMPWQVKDEILVVRTEARSILQKPQTECDSTIAKTGQSIVVDDIIDRPKDSRLRYRIHFEGGRIKMDPLLDVSVPMTSVAGERSSLCGISLETFLHSANVKYKKPVPEVAKHGLSLQQIADLPENVRLRLLLFLSDLKPLELALGIKPEMNSFLRYRSVNKGLVKVARRQARITKVFENQGTEQLQPSTRQEVMAELMKLDDEELSLLWRNHLRHKRRGSKRS